MKNILVVLALLFSTTAFAIGLGNDNPPSEGGATNNTNTNQQGQQQGQIQGNVNVLDIRNRIDNDVRTNAVAFSAANSTSNTESNSTSNSTGGNSTSTASGGNSNSGGNTLSVGGNSVVVTDSGKLKYSGEIRNVPNVQVANVYPTSPCMGSSSAGGSGVGFGVSFGTSWTDDECSKREAARSFASIGLVEDAVAILCSTEAAVVAPSCKPKE